MHIESVKFVYVVYLSYLVVSVGKDLYLGISDFRAPLIKVCPTLAPLIIVCPKMVLLIKVYPTVAHFDVGYFVSLLYLYILFIVELY